MLVGGQGQDTLTGGDDHDFLMGGVGFLDEANNFFHVIEDAEADRLEGGAGDDVYWAGAGDTISDADGKGLVYVSVTLASGAEVYAPLGQWGIRATQDPARFTEYNEFLDLTFHYTYDAANQTLIVNDAVTFENFSDGELNIGLGWNSFLWYQYDSYWWNVIDENGSKPAEAYYASYDPWWFLLTQEENTPDTDHTDDNITGTDSADQIDSGGGDDLVSAGEGNDQVHGDSGNDLIRGDGGDDRLYGDEGDDRLLGGEGLDWLSGGLGNDTLRGGPGDGDTLSGDRGDDTYLFAAGDGDTTIDNYDNIIGRHDVLRFLSGIEPSDVRATRADDDLLLTLDSGGETITVTNYFIGDGVGYALDAIEFADGTQWDIDHIKAQVQRPTNGADSLYGYAGDDRLVAWNGDDNLYSANGNDTLSGGRGNDRVEGQHGNDVLFGNAGNDELYGGAGNDHLMGGEGSDRLFGGEGNDRLRGNAGGGDTLTGGAGNDTYVYARGDGDTTIDNHDTSAGRWDVLRFLGGVEPGDIRVGRKNYDLLLTLQSSGEVITVTGYFVDDGTGGYALNVIVFADGTRWNVDSVLAQALQGSAESDTIFGYAGADTIDGLGGNDTLVGGDGNDTLRGGEGYDLLYGGNGDDRLAGGAGNDRLSGEAGNDYLTGGEGYDTLYGGSGDDTLVCGTGSCSGEAGNDTYIYAAGSGDTAIFNNDPDATGVDKLIMEGVDASDITFWRGRDSELVLRLNTTRETITIRGYFSQDGATGQVLDSIDFRDGVSWDFDTINAQTRQATDGPDNLYCYSYGDTLNGLGGNDNLFGAAGDDRLYGNAGNDYLNGAAGNDTLAGGIGNDRLFGESGSDEYLFNLGDGQDTILDETKGGASDRNRLGFGEGITSEAVRFSRDNINDLLIQIADTADSVRISHYFSSTRDYPIEIGFSDGTIVTREAITNLVSGLTDQDDYYLGTDGADTVHLLQGNDSADGGDGDDHLFGDEGNDNLLGGAGDDQLDGGSGNDNLFAQSGHDILSGGAGDDALDGGEGDDRLRGGPGNDQLTGGRGSDVYLFDAGDGHDTIDNSDVSAASHDVLRFLAGVSVADVTPTRSAYDLRLTLNSTGESITVTDFFTQDSLGDNALDAIEFADGAVWDVQYINHAVLQGSEGDDRLYAYSTGSTIDGLGGNDTLTGAAGDDRLSGGSGNDTLHGNEGSDTLRGDSGNDILQGDAGDDRLSGGAGDDLLIGGDGDDLLNTSSGADTLMGGLGNDTYRLGLVAGENLIKNSDGSGASTHDKVVFDAGITPDRVVLSRADHDLVMAYSGSITRVEGFFHNSEIHNIDSFRFQDGASWSYDAVRAMLLQGDSSDQTIVGYETDDAIDGGAGNDTIDGAAGSDQLYGGAGDDTLLGGGIGNDDRNDVLVGGTGNNHLEGGAGDDIYRFQSDDGQDTIGDTRGNNRIEYLDLASTGAIVRRSGNDLTLSNRNNNDQVTVIGQFNGAELIDTGNSIREITFADNVTWSITDLLSQAVLGTATDDAIQGFNGTETLDGLGGNDAIASYGGSDTVHGGDGNDQIDGGSGNDTLYGDGDMDHYGPGLRYTESAHDQLYGGDGDDRLYGGSRYEFDAFRDENVDTLHGGTGSDYLYGQGELYGEAGDDELIGRGLLSGGSGHDTIRAINAGTLDIAINGGTGDDTLWGIHSTTRFSFALGDGQDILHYNIPRDTPSEALRQDTVLFGAGIATSDVRFERQQNALLVRYGSSNDQLTINDWFLVSNRGKTLRFEFSDGSVITDDALTGLSANEPLITASGNDALAGGDDQATITQEYDRPVHTVDRIETDASALLNNQVEQLIATMAVFDASSGVGHVIPQDVREGLQPILVENWQAGA
ncbi:MAG: calcium-binding protein [Candidatus Thiodiazotropha sp. (ex Dulcina madagascariensis)]|nr:calcium-binding protein [Candidatus Thiodiazotropha sp. (ex Dulcina madagascariensis)]